MRGWGVMREGREVGAGRFAVGRGALRLVGAVVKVRRPDDDGATVIRLDWVRLPD